MQQRKAGNQYCSTILSNDMMCSSCIDSESNQHTCLLNMIDIFHCTNPKVENKIKKLDSRRACMDPHPLAITQTQ